ncbi:MAG: hypothetical protein F4X26_05275 [Chloroflexi bacterium]|nr:hypothetical protein [Chloroflexota bacterium]
MVLLVAGRLDYPLSLREAIHVGLLLRLREVAGSIEILSRHPSSITPINALARLVLETSVDIEYLCRHGDDDTYWRFALSGLKVELALAEDLQARVAARGGSAEPMESRLVDASMERMHADGFSTDDVVEAPKQWGPDFASKLRAIGSDEPRHYLFFQRYPSSYIHGTWVSLRNTYIGHQDGGYVVYGDWQARNRASLLPAIGTVVCRALAAHIHTFHPEDAPLRSSVARIVEYLKATELASGDFQNIPVHGMEEP